MAVEHQGWWSSDDGVGSPAKTGTARAAHGGGDDARCRRAVRCRRRERKLRWHLSKARSDLVGDQVRLCGDDDGWRQIAGKTVASCCLR